jgi:hypothetical protein
MADQGDAFVFFGSGSHEVGCGVGRSVIHYDDVPDKAGIPRRTE